MMMPANYSVIAENEMTYVVGGGVIEAIGAVTAPIWTAANVKQFSTNIVTLVGNAYVGDFVQKTFGVLFNKGNTTWNDVKNIPASMIGGKEQGLGSQIFHALGMAAGAYNLGMVSVANKAGDTVLFKADPKPSKKYYGTVDGKAFEIWG